MNRTEVLPGVWHLEEDYRVYCTLVQGKTLALLWDTGQGRTDLAAYVAQQVSTPCLVLNSHGHSDHIGGNFRFPQVYAHRADWPLLAAYARLTGRETPVCPLEPGQSFALGGRRAEVISLAGHTKGSVGLLLAGEGLLLAGDGLNQTLLLLGAEAAPLSQLRQTLEAVLRLPFAHYLSSHHLDRLRLEDPSRPGPYAPRVCRSQYREQGSRSVLLIDRGLVGEENCLP